MTLTDKQLKRVSQSRRQGQSKRRPKFRFNISGSFTVAEIWPDGDAPENPTEEDVWAVLHGFTGEDPQDIAEMLIDWNLKVDNVDVEKF